MSSGVSLNGGSIIAFLCLKLVSPQYDHNITLKPRPSHAQFISNAIKIQVEMIPSYVNKIICYKLMLLSVSTGKLLKDSWTSVDTQDILLQPIPSCFDDKVGSLLSFIYRVTFTLITWVLDRHSREDYMELLELALLFLGGSIEMKKGWEFHLRRTRADHHLTMHALHGG